MPFIAFLRSETARSRSASFTLIELLTVMAIIAILASLILYAGSAVITKGMRSRASSEIQAMSTALEGYKTDNGIYPPSSSSSFVTNYTTVDVATVGAAGYYILSSETIYQALSGQTNFLDAPVGNKAYMSFRANQLGNVSAPIGTTTAGATTYVQDPFKYSYGYSTGYVSGATTNYPYNGNGFFDIWSTGGTKGATAANTNSWISNWQ
jgi:prepilin-type N-terminal cleavage/methylation domain-containing protein